MKRDKFSSRLTLAGSVGLIAVAPVVAEASVVTVKQSISIAQGVPSNNANWDVDGNGTVDFVLQKGGGRYSHGHTWLRPGGTQVVSREVTYSYAMKIDAIGRTKFNGGLVGDALLDAMNQSENLGPTHSYRFSYGFVFPFGHTMSVLPEVVRSTVKFRSTVFSVPDYENDTAIKSTRTSSELYGYNGIGLGPHKIGFRFFVDGQDHYGWANIRLQQGARGNKRLEVTQWSYETDPETPIHIRAVPAPPAGVAALTLLGLGAAGLRSWRKGKRSSTPALNAVAGPT